MLRAYREDVRAIRTRMGEASLLQFAKLYLGPRFTLPWNRMHREINEELQRSAGSPLRFVVAAPDGYGKSSLLSFAFILWALAYRKHRCIVLGAASRSAAGEHLAGVDSEIRTNELLRRDFPHLENVARTSGASGSRASPPRLLALPGVAKVHTIGPSSHLTEVTFEGRRPDIFVLDEFDAGGHDQADFSNANSRSLRLEKTLKQRILNRFTDASIIVAGPLLEPSGLIDRLLDPSRSQLWTQRFYPAVEKYPMQFDRWFEWAALQRSSPGQAADYLRRYRAEMHEDASVLWSERESFERLMRLRLDHGWEWFDAYRQGCPPGGCLRVGRNQRICLGSERDDGHVVVIDDAGYRRRLRRTALQQKPQVEIVIEGTEPEGRQIPETAASGDETPQF